MSLLSDKTSESWEMSLLVGVVIVELGKGPSPVAP